MFVPLFREFMCSDQVSSIYLTSWRLPSSWGSSLAGQTRKAAFLISVIIPIPALARKIEVQITLVRFSEPFEVCLKDMYRQI